MKKYRLITIFLFFALGATAAFSQQGKAPPLIVFISDFGTKDDSVAVCKGVMLNIEPEARIIDITHEVPPFDIDTAGRLLAGSAAHFPSHAIFVAVIDPGVGSERKAIVVRTRKGQMFVGPDNGIFTAVADQDGIEEIREITNTNFTLYQKYKYTFHGRDIFSPTAAHLAKGTGLASVGPPLEKIVRLDRPRAVWENNAISGIVDFIEEPYGNVITNIPAALPEKAAVNLNDMIKVQIGSEIFFLPFKRTFSDVASGEALALLSSRGYLSLAINKGNFAQKHKIKPKQTIIVTKQN